MRQANRDRGIDFADAGQVQHLVERLGEIDILVNNVGIFDVRSFTDISDDEWQRYFDVNVMSGVRLSRHVLDGMLARWSMGMDAIDAHWELAKYEAEQAAAAAAVRDHYEPRVVWTGYTTLRDEFSYPIRSTPGIVDRADNLSRSNRSVGTAEMKITHSPKDMLSLPNPEDREKARGLAERSGLLALMSLTRSDLEELSDVKPLTKREIDEVVRFNGSSSWAKTSSSVVTKPGQAAVAPPGAGKVLFKVEGRPGISVQMVQTDVQKSLHITDSRFRAQHESTAKRRSA